MYQNALRDYPVEPIQWTPSRAILWRLHHRLRLRKPGPITSTPPDTDPRLHGRTSVLSLDVTIAVQKTSKNLGPKDPTSIQSGPLQPPRISPPGSSNWRLYSWSLSFSATLAAVPGTRHWAIDTGTLDEKRTSSRQKIPSRVADMSAQTLRSPWVS